MTDRGGYAREPEYELEGDPNRVAAVVLNPYLLTLRRPGTQGGPFVRGDLVNLLPEDIGRTKDAAAAALGDDLIVTVVSDVDGTTPVEGADVVVETAVGFVSGVSGTDGTVTFHDLPSFPDDPGGQGGESACWVRASIGEKTWRIPVWINAKGDGAYTATIAPATPAAALAVTCIGSPPVVGALVAVSTAESGEGFYATSGADGIAHFPAGLLPAIGGVQVYASKGSGPEDPSFIEDTETGVTLSATTPNAVTLHLAPRAPG